MSIPIAVLPLSNPTDAVLKKKRVLLIDTSALRRDLRAETMRKLGIDVDCAADIAEARCWWRADLYNLVLVPMESEVGHRDKFCEDVRGATPPQQIAFMVGKPGYLANAPNADETPAIPENGHQSHNGDVKAALSAEISGVLPQRWGILEASRRISAVRSLSHARSQARRERPVPPRDLETRESRRSATWSHVVSELRREEIQ